MFKMLYFLKKKLKNHCRVGGSAPGPPSLRWQ